jgi:hypothetical protein
MSLIPIPPDKTGEIAQLINAFSDECGNFMADRLTRLLKAVNPVKEQFFEDPRVGENGAALLTVLRAHVQFMAQLYPTRMNKIIATADQYLNIRQDGRVTYDPPPVFIMPMTHVIMLGDHLDVVLRATNKAKSYTVSGLPDGMLFNGIDQISGAPKTAGDYFVTVEALAPKISSGPQTLLIVVQPLPEPEPEPDPEAGL